MRAKITSFKIVLRFIIAGMLTGLLTSQLTAAQGWYDTDWQYRSLVTIPNPGTAELTEFQVKITLTGGTGGNFDFAKSLAANGSDIRFTASDGTTLIPNWIETWNTTGLTATIWVKVPSIPTLGTTVYVYYGNASPTLPSEFPVETPPIGPFTRAAGNPITPAGATGVSLLAENIVFDPVTQHYWMCMANYSQSAISLCWSNTPTDPASWTWGGNVVTSFTSFYSGAPHLLNHNNTWYLFYADRPNIEVATASNVAGPYTINPTPVLTPTSPTGAWDSFRVDEPYVFQRNDGKWILIYMADAGDVTEQVGYATADNVGGPYTAYEGNPVLRFGVPGSFDAGTVADPWVYEYHGNYYIGYTVSSTKNSPWQTALATTTDWITFTKHGVILPASGTVLDAQNSFRGALTRIGDEYVFSYTNDGYRMAIATQPVFMAPPNIVNIPDAVFDFYDGFDGTSLDGTKWGITNGSASQVSVSGGSATLTSGSEYIRISGTSSFGMNYIGETRANHPNQGTYPLIAEVGFASADYTTVRIVDDFMLGTTYWQRQAKIAPANDLTHPFYNMAQTADRNWHIFRVYRQGSDIAGFQVDDNTVETTNVNVPLESLPPFLMAYSEGAANSFIVDWTRVRKWAGADPVITIAPTQTAFGWKADASTSEWSTPGNWYAGLVPTSGNNVVITAAANYPVISSTSGAAVCNNLTIEPLASLTLNAGASLTVSGSLTINSSGTGNNGSLINYSSASLTATYNRYLRPDDVEGEFDEDRHFFSSPVGGMLISDFITANSSKINQVSNVYQIWGWDESSSTNNWPLISSGSFVTGKGYNIDQAAGSDGLLTFTGSVINTVTFTATSPYDLSYDVRYSLDPLNPDPYGVLNNNADIWATDRSWTAYGGGGWNLMGNPFTSAMNAATFISTNTTKIDPHYLALYVYDGISNVYKYAAASAPGFPTGLTGIGGYVQTGQGFFVLAQYNGAVFNFDSNMQLHHNALNLLKSAKADEPWPGLQLKVKYGNRESLTTVVYNSEMTRGLDPGYDVGQLSTAPGVEIYTALVEKDNSVNFARQALPMTDYDKNIIPVGIDTEKGGEVTFLAYTVPLDSYRFWLEDRTMGTYTNLNTGTYTVTLPANTYGTGRFFIIASANMPTGIEKPQAGDTDIRVWASKDRVIIKGEVSDRAVCEVYDLRGQKILETRLVAGEQNTVTLPSDLNGIYLVRVTDGAKITIRKVALL